MQAPHGQRAAGHLFHEGAAVALLVVAMRTGTGNHHSTARFPFQYFNLKRGQPAI